MKKIFFIIIFILLFSPFSYAENAIETGTISHSQVVIFQGNQFDLGNEKQFKKFIDSLQNYPALVHKLESFFKVSLDELKVSLNELKAQNQELFNTTLYG